MRGSRKPNLRRRARHQLQIKNALVEFPVKGGPGLHLRLIEVAQHAAIAHGGQLGIVYALEGVHALGAHLAGARAGDHAAVKDHANAMRTRVRGVSKGVEQVFAGVRVLRVDGLLRAGQDYRLDGALHKVAQRRGGVSQRICSMGDHKAIKAVVILLNASGNLQPVLRAHIRRIQVKELAAFDAADLRQARRAGEKLFGAQKRRKPLRCGL